MLHEDDVYVTDLLSPSVGREEEDEEKAHADEGNDILDEINDELNTEDCGKEISAGLAKIVDRRFEAKPASIC